MSEVHLDFAFPGSEEDPQKTMAVLVGIGKMMMSAAVLPKTTRTYSANRVPGFLT